MRIKWINITFLLVAIVFASCENYLDLAPELDLTEAEVFENYQSVQGYLDVCYSSLDDHSEWEAQKFDRNHVAAMSDEASSTYQWAKVVSVINTGNWLDQGNQAEVGWTNDAVGTLQGRVIANSFYAIRIANKVLENVPEMNLSVQEKNELLGQAYFFRSWFYFEIIRRWGGMFIMDQAYNSDDILDLPRLTYSESTEWLIEGLDEAIKLLPDNWEAANKGRADKVAAMAVKEMAALYAASPLMQNGLEATVQREDYSLEWSKRAARYAADVLKYIDAKMPERQMKGEGMSPEEQKENYKHIFYHYPNFVSTEALWYNNSNGENRDVDMSIHFQNIRFSKRSGNYGWATTSPSQNLVDMFEMADGTPFDWNNPAHAAAPYENRDPRFYNNILYAGRAHGVDASGKTMYLETWDGGKDLNSDYSRSIPTGYMCIKWWWPEANGYNKPGYAMYYYNGMFIRTTQVWLDLAEAMNEAYGPDLDPDGLGYTALDALKKVRARIGMQEVRSEFTGSKEALRERIRNERAVELMFENHRWFDIRRWMIAEDVLGGTYPIQGISIQKVSGTGPTNWVFNYSVKDVVTEVRVFEKKHYWYPVAYDHVQQYTNFKQNPGW